MSSTAGDFGGHGAGGRVEISEVEHSEIEQCADEQSEESARVRPNEGIEVAPVDDDAGVPGWVKVKGWWRCDLEQGAWSKGLRLEFTDEINEELEKASGNGRSEDVNAAQLLPLQALSYATQLLVTDEGIGEGRMAEQLENALKLADNPVPILESLNICGSMPETLKHSLLEAIKSDKLMGLRYLTVLGDVDWLLENAFPSGHLQALLEIYFGRSKIGDEGVEALASALESGHLQALRAIRFPENEIGDKGVQALVNALESGHLQALQEINFGNNKIGDEGVEALASALESGHLPALRTIDFAENEIGDKGVQALAMAFASGQVNMLWMIDLKHNYAITEEGVESLLGAFSTNNKFTAEIGLEWYKYPKLDRLRQELLQRNSEMAQIFADLGEILQVPAKFAKIYLCGNPEVGKTTLRKSMDRSLLRSLCMRERKPRQEKRTRGIEVSQLISDKGGKKMTLLVWDMAGQDEYHFIHNSFFPDLAFAEGKATTFVVVCNSTNEKVEEELGYWLQFIASSCDKSVQTPRHVLVVLNRTPRNFPVSKNHWKQLLDRQRKFFKGYLNVVTEPFVMDVRKRRIVKVLKEHLIKHSAETLENEKVPEICDFIQSQLSAWSNDKKEFPILTWVEFVDKIKFAGKLWEEKTLLATVKYLHEAGVVIYIDKQFPTELGLGYKRLLVLDPNWLCREVLGHTFLPNNMKNSGESLFRLKVDGYTGSISMSDFKEFLGPLLGDLKNSEFEDLVAILMWLGLCYKGHQRNVFIPALIEKNATLNDLWQRQGGSLQERRGQWIMGFRVEHDRETVIKLAPVSLWHKFQVELAQNFAYNGPTSEFVIGKYFVTFQVDFMAVLIKVDTSQSRLAFDGIDTFVKPLGSHEIDNLIEVNAIQNRLTFDGIDIFVKPLWVPEADLLHLKMDLNKRKQHQVDLASNLKEILITQWSQVCPGVPYVERIVWPWPASGPRVQYKFSRDVTVEIVKQWLQEHGLGIPSPWTVGFDIITEDQLLARKDKEYVIQSVLGSINVLRKRTREAVELGIFPQNVFDEEGSCVESTMTSGATEKAQDQAFSSTPSKEVDEAMQSMTQEFFLAEMEKFYNRVDKKVDSVRRTIVKEIRQVGSDIRNDLSELMRTQKNLLRNVQDIGRIFWEDRESSCPRFIYLGQRKSDAWTTLKDAISKPFKEKVHVNFMCEARYSDYRQHPVKDQQGIDVSHMTAWGRKIAPWLKVSLTVLFVSANVAANVVAPGVGLVPGLVALQQASSLVNGIALTTGFSPEQLDEYIHGGIRPDVNSTPKNPQELFGKCRKAMTELLGKLTDQQYEERLGLRKVHLKQVDGTSHIVDGTSPSVAWICSECYGEWRSRNLVSDL